MKPSFRRLLPLVVIATVACAFSFGGGNVTSCEGGCFGAACETPVAR